MVDLLLEGAEGDSERLAAGLVSVKDCLEDVGLHARKTQTEFKALGSVGAEFSQSLGAGISELTRGMTNAFDRFVRTGKLSFSDLKNVAVGALDAIYDQAISAGLNSLFGSGGGGGIFGSLLSGLGASFAPRAMGGPVTAGQPFLVGEAGPEIFIPGQQGRIHRPQNSAASAINVTINMSGDTGGGRASRQSASQIASQVSRAVTRAQRNG